MVFSTLLFEELPSAEDDDRPVPECPRRLLIILHGLRASNQDIRDAVKAARATGIEVDVRVTWEGGDTGRFIQSELFGDGDHAPLNPPGEAGVTIVAAGGDGTINECAAALLEAGLPANVSLAVLPLGTSNDFATTCNIPKDFEQALRLAADSDCVHPIDIGLLNGKVFMNTASLGAGSEIGGETSAAAKAALGTAAFVFGGLTTLVTCAPVGSKLVYPSRGSSVPPTQQPEPQVSPLASMEDREGITLAAEMASAAVSAFFSGPSARPATPPPQGASTPKTTPEATAAQDGGDAGGTDAGTEVAGPGSADAVGLEHGAEGGEEEDEGEEVVEVELLHLTACNNRQIASMVQPCPGALLDDGCLDMIYIVGHPANNVLSVLDLLTSGGGGSGALASSGDGNGTTQGMVALRVPWLEVRCDSEMPAVCDGDPIASSTTFRLEVVAGRLPFHLPDNRLLASGVGGAHDTAPGAVAAAASAAADRGGGVCTTAGLVPVRPHRNRRPREMLPPARHVARRASPPPSVSSRAAAFRLSAVRGVAAGGVVRGAGAAAAGARLGRLW